MAQIIYVFTLLLASTCARDVKITVGAQGLFFSPNKTIARKGDRLIFDFSEFYPGNNAVQHSVVASSFEKPCQPLQNTIFSGVIGQNTTERFFVVNVNSSDALWLYCSFSAHCAFEGMVAVVNEPTNGATLEKYKSAAANTTFTSAPGTFPMGGILYKSAPSSSAAVIEPEFITVVVIITLTLAIFLPICF